MPSFYAHLMNLIFKKMAKPMDENHDFVKERENNAKQQNIRLPKTLQSKEITLNGISGEIITNKKNNNGKIIYYIHGGGFTTGSYKERRRFTYYLAKKYGFTVIANDYRLSPENKWPCHLNDCMAFYQGVLENYNAKDITFVGESAGGTLVLALALKTNDEGISLPNGIISLSPCVNQTEEYPSRINNKKTDTMIGLSYNQDIQNKIIFANEMENHSVYANPILGDYAKLPPIYLNTTDNEIFYDDSIQLYEKLKKENHKVVLEVQKGVFHAYPTLPFVKEARITIENVVHFIYENCH